MAEIEARADDLLGPHNTSEAEAQKALVLGKWVNWIMRIRGLATPECPELLEKPSRGERTRGWGGGLGTRGKKRAVGSASAPPTIDVEGSEGEGAEGEAVWEDFPHALPCSDARVYSS